MSVAGFPILKRLVPSLRKRIVPLIWPRGWRVAEIDGALFLVNYFSFTDRIIGFDKQWERPQIRYMLENIRQRRCEVFMDIGAYGGLYAILVALETRCDRVVAFEPDLNCRERLKTNLHLNGLTNRIEVRDEAVSDHNGQLPFLHETLFGAGKSRVVERSDYSVRCARIDDVIGLSGRTVAIKLDVEYHEREALVGMERLLRTNRCFLQVECPDDHMTTVEPYLKALQYTLVHSISPHDRYFVNF